MWNSEILQTFDEGRTELKPYGLTCELWTPSLMRKPDRHNEIELNYFPEGSITYLFQEHKISIPPKRLCLFWGLVPHQIIDYEGAAPYYVCTVPFSQFLEWKLPASFTERVLKGEVLVEGSEESYLYNEFLLRNWVEDINQQDHVEMILLELQARLSRFAHSNLPKKVNEQAALQEKEISQVEKIAIYIAQNYQNSVKVADIGKAVGLHPDYANTIFKKAFGRTLSEYIMEERISNAQRKLVATDVSITEISYACGFNSISCFNAAFLKINGCTPREFRKRYL